VNAARAALPLLLLGAAGCAGGLTARLFPEPPELRFVTAEDLGAREAPIPLDVVFTIHPRLRIDGDAIAWTRPGQDPGFDLPTSFRSLTQNVLASLFRTAVEAPPGLYLRIEELRRALAQKARLREDLPTLGAKALVLVDFRPPLKDRPDLKSQLSVRIYDISCPRYEELPLFNPRLLVFEDYAEVASLERPSRLTGMLVPAWREVCGRLLTSQRFQSYLALASGSLDPSREEAAHLLGLVSKAGAGAQGGTGPEAWIEPELLFPARVARRGAAGTAGQAAPPPEPASPAESPQKEGNDSGGTAAQSPGPVPALPAPLFTGDREAEPSSDTPGRSSGEKAALEGVPAPPPREGEPR